MSVQVTALGFLPVTVEVTGFGDIDLATGDVTLNMETVALEIGLVPNVPTLSRWGLILFGLLLFTAMFVTIRRHALPARETKG